MNTGSTHSSHDTLESGPDSPSNRDRPRRTRRILWAILISISLPILGLSTLSLFSHLGSAKVGLVNGTLRDCPDSPNCVSSLAEREDQFVSPLPMPEDASKSVEMLVEVVNGMPRARVVTVDGPYVHAEFQTRLLRFVDDVEFLVDPTAHVIQVRSASRTGRSDLGANRKRVEELRTRLESWLSQLDRETP